MNAMTREGFARGLIRGLQRQGIGESVHLRGSLARGQGDAMSDIDIGVRDEQSSDQHLAALVIAHLEQCQEVLFYDWATSLLPDTCVLTFFLKDLPLFWHVDVELLVNPGMRVLSRNQVTNHPRDHGLKLWILAAKQVARNTETAGDQVDRLYGRTFDGADGITDRVAKLRAILESIVAEAPGSYGELVDQCRQFQRKLEERPVA